MFKFDAFFLNIFKLSYPCVRARAHVCVCVETHRFDMLEASVMGSTLTCFCCMKSGDLIWIWYIKGWNLTAEQKKKTYLKWFGLEKIKTEISVWGCVDVALLYCYGQVLILGHAFQLTLVCGHQMCSGWKDVSINEVHRVWFNSLLRTYAWRTLGEYYTKIHFTSHF